jgi:hypothetical protein
MRIRLLAAAWPAILACSIGLQPACADIYTWIDASGTVNVSNLSPPEDVRVTSLMRESPPKTDVRDDAAREAVRQAELQALSDRVRQLENEAEVARRPAPPPQVVYVPVPVPVSVPAPAPVQYQAESAPPPSGGCDPSWSSCWGWWGAGFYPASVIVVRAPFMHGSAPGEPGHRFPPGQPWRRFPSDQPGHRFPLQGPVLGSLGFRGH